MSGIEGFVSLREDEAVEWIAGKDGLMVMGLIPMISGVVNEAGNGFGFVGLHRTDLKHQVEGIIWSFDWVAW